MGICKAGGRDLDYGGNGQVIDIWGVVWMDNGWIASFFSLFVENC